MPDALETIDKLEKRLARIRRQENATKAQLEMTLLLADVGSLLREIDTRHMSESNRIRLAGVKKRVFTAIGAAA